MKSNNNNVYIRSIEAETIYTHVIRDGYVKNEYKGMMPFSLGLKKLRLEGIETKLVKDLEKEICNDVINVKFSKGVMSAIQLIKDKNKKLANLIKTQSIGEIKTLEDMQKEYNRLCDIDKLDHELSENDKKPKSKLTESEKYSKSILEKTIKYATKLTKDIETITKGQLEDKWGKVENDNLRIYLYTNGFTITSKKYNISDIVKTDDVIVDENGIVIDIITYDKFCVYKRSVSKSRVGNVLFIKENLHENMIKYARMNLPFDEKWEGDFTSLLATESLIESSLEDTLIINPKNILIVSDVDSKFFWDVNVIKTDETTKRLDSFPIDASEKNEEYMVSNSLFDGSSLLEKEYFEDGVSMKLLRHHMFKSASFSTNISMFLRQKAIDLGKNYDTWEIPSMFDDKKGVRDTMLAKNVKMIITPNSLKALKLTKPSNMSEEHLLNYKGLEMTNKEMWEYWKQIVKDEGCIFGVCKSEHESKRGTDDLGNILQQQSYQTINSVNYDKDSMFELTKLEREYIEKLKNDNNFFIEYLESTANDVNANKMMATLARHNSDFMGTKIFRDLKSKKVVDYKKHIKHGKVRCSGDYGIILGNGLEYLYHAIGLLDTENPQSLALNGNEMYTKMFGTEDKAFNKEYVCFRNPNTSPSNILVARNIYNSDLEKYFNMSKNVVIVNAINFPIQDILSSMDYDSDSMAIYDSSTMLKFCKSIYEDRIHRVNLNGVGFRKNNYKITNENMAEIDNKLALSVKNIGFTTNIGQYILSTYWEKLSENKGVQNEDTKKLLKKIDVCSILATICIDLAKKSFNIELDKEIKNLTKGIDLDGMKPSFFKYISKSKNIGNKIRDYNTSMDYLVTIIDDITDADGKPNVDFNTLLVNKETIKSNNKLTKTKKKDKVDRKQRAKIFGYATELDNIVDGVYAKYKGKDEEDEIKEKNNLLTDAYKHYNVLLGRLTLNSETLYTILNNETNFKVNKNLLNLLFKTQYETFMKSFKQK